MNQGANTSPFTQIGHIARSHGLNGELKINFETENPEALESLEMVYLRNDRGDFYPCRISNLRVEGKGNSISFFVQFDHIADRNAAELLSKRALFIETEKADALLQESPADDDLMDFEVLDENSNSIGLVIDYMDSGAQVVITVATTSGSLLIPVVDEYVLEIDENQRTIQCQNLNLLEDL